MALDLASMFSSVSSALGFNVMFFWLDKFAAIIGAWWLGGKFTGKFEAKLDSKTLLFLRIISGTAIYFMGIIIGTKFFAFLPGSIADFAGAFVIFIFFYLFSSMLARGVAYKTVARGEFSKLLKRVDRLEALMERLVGAVTNKKIMPEKLDSKSAEMALKKALKERKKIEDFVVVDSKKEKDSMIFIVKCKIRSFRIVLDAYSGELLDISHLADTPKNVLLSALNFGYEHKLAVAGAVLIIIFVNYVLLLNTPAVEQRLSELASLTPPEVNESFGLQDLVGGMGFLPQDTGLSPEQVQGLLSQGAGQ